MRRRELITVLVGVAAALAFVARAQSAHPIPKIGWLKIQGRQHTPDQLKAFREGMKALGLVEGRDFVLEERYADGDEGRLPSLAAELIDSGVWSGAGLLGPEALPPRPFLDLLTDYGSPWALEERTPA